MDKDSTPQQKNKLLQRPKTTVSIKTQMWRAIGGLILLSGLLMTLDNGTPDCSVSIDLVPFECDGTLFLFQKKPTVFTMVQADGSLLEFGKASACPDGGTKLAINGQGFRSSDGFIYGMSKISNTIVDIFRIGAEGRTEYYAEIEAPSGYQITHYVGEIDQNSIYYIPGKGPDNKKVLLTLDLNEVDRALAGVIPMPEPVPHTLSSNLPSIHDWAFNPIDNNLYSVVQNSGDILVIDVSQDPMQVTRHKSDGTKMGPFGAVYFGADGTLYASQNNDGTHSNIYRINYDCPGDDCTERILLGSSDKVSLNDGASCTFAQPSLNMRVSPPFAIPGDTLTYHFEFVNPTIEDLEAEFFRLQLADSMGSAKFSRNSLSDASRMVNVHNYGDASSLTIDRINIPKKANDQAGTTSFDVQVTLPADANMYGSQPRVQASFEYAGRTHMSSDVFLPPGNATPVQIVQPYTITKRIAQGDPLPGNRIQYETTIFNPNEGGKYDGAYRVNFTDVMQKGGNWASNPAPSLQSSNPNFVYGDATIEDSTVSIQGILLEPGDQVTIQYYADIDASLVIGESVESEATAIVPQTNIVTAAQENTITMPVEYLFFEVESRDDRAFLVWATAVELNNQGFSVEMSDDGKAFKTLGWVEGNGTTNTMADYSFETDRLATGSHVFRLKQIDFDGAFEYSKMVEVAIDAPQSMGSLEFGPNPFWEEGKAVLRLNSDQHMEVVVLDINGRPVAQLYRGLLRANEPHEFRFKAGDLPSGYYILTAQNENLLLTEKILLQHR